MEPDFDLVVEADAGPRKSFKDFCTEVAFHVEDHDIIQGERPCSEKRWKGLHHALQEKTNELHAMVTHALHTEKPQKRILWENCVAAVAEALNMETRLFGYRTGWNFNLKEHRVAFVQLIDEILFMPTCGPWSPTLMSNGNGSDTGITTPT